MDKGTAVTRYLDEKNIPYRLFQHHRVIHSLEEAAEERGQRPGQIIRSILFRLSQGEYLMVLIAGPQQISWRSLRSYLDISRLTMASEAEVLAATGYQIGAVSPFGLLYPIRILVDESIFLEEEISIGSGVRGLAVIMGQAAFRDALGTFESGHFTE
jgi:Cys-tRNA(Pro)/Cys-tRNA(Cys) deacylase